MDLKTKPAEHLRGRAFHAREVAKGMIDEATDFEKKAEALRISAVDWEKQADAYEIGANLLDQSPDFAKMDGVKR